MSIKYLEEKDKDKLIEFIKHNWKENHIFVEDREYLEYELSDNSNFLIYEENEEILAILGIIDYGKNSDLFGMIWKSISKGKGLGFLLLQHILKMEKRSYNAVGISEMSKPFYKLIDMDVKRLKHFYIVNNELKDYKIAKITNKKEYKKLENNAVIKFSTMKNLLENMDYNKFSNLKPFKTKEYFEKRYFNHLYYKYNIISINEENKNSLLVYRVVKENDSCCIRIIDFIGDENDIPKYMYQLVKKMKEIKAEYIDFYEYGIADDILLEAGFIERLEDDENIIPNYFEPFEQSNKEIYAASTYKDNFRLFKGDADQDRPSISRKEK